MIELWTQCIYDGNLTWKQVAHGFRFGIPLLIITSTYNIISINPNMRLSDILEECLRIDPNIDTTFHIFLNEPFRTISNPYIIRYNKFNSTITPPNNYSRKDLERIHNLSIIENGLYHILYFISSW